MRRRIWCETVPAAEIATPSVIALLQRFRLAPIVAVFPHTLDDDKPALARLAASGIPIAAWPMLSDADGRWLGAANAERFAAFTDLVARTLDPTEIVLDLEPPIEGMKLTLASLSVHVRVLPPGADPAEYRVAERAIEGLTRRLRARGIAVSAAIAPPILFDRGRAWEARLGTPVSGIAWDHASAMLYTSIIEGWSRGALRREDTRAILGAACLACAERFGAAAGVSLGAVGTGAFGDEPTYRAPSELADDVAIARAACIDDLALFDLGGVLGRGPPEPWLEAFTNTAPAPRLPDPTIRARAVIAGLSAAGSAFAALSAVGEWAQAIAGRVPRH